MALSPTLGGYMTHSAPDLSLFNMEDAVRSNIESLSRGIL